MKTCYKINISDIHVQDHLNNNNNNNNNNYDNIYGSVTWPYRYKGAFNPLVTGCFGFPHILVHSFQIFL